MLCECGCGLTTPLATKDRPERGYVKGQPQRFARGHSSRRRGVRYVVVPGPFATPCHVWALRIRPDGYGTQQLGGRTRYAHIVAYEAVHGPVPHGLTLDHLCRNRACVNVEHLEPVTNQENTLRGVGPTAVNARKTHCIRGHPLNGANLIAGPNGRRTCRTCANATRRQYKARQRAAKTIAGNAFEIVHVPSGVNGNGAEQPKETAA